MAFQFDFKTLLFAGLLLGLGCGQDTAPTGSTDDEETDEEETDEDEATASKDAGKKDAGKDSGKDAGKKDAGKAEPADEEDPSDEPDDSPVDAGAKESDAGAKTDAGAAKADAGPAMSGGDAGAGGSSCEDLTYEKFGKMFIDTYCIGCHANTMPQLKTLDAIVTNKARIQAQAVTNKAMPPITAPKKPTDPERMKLGQWLMCGPK